MGMGGSGLISMGMSNIEIEIAVEERPRQARRGGSKRRQKKEYIIRCKIKFLNDEEPEKCIQNEIIIPIDNESQVNIKLMEAFYKEFGKLIPIHENVDEFRKNPISVIVESFRQLVIGDDIKVKSKIKKVKK